MTRFVPFRITIDPEILGLLEAISRKQGELAALKRNAREDFRIEAVANVDAVHFSTKIEGNPLTRDQVTRALEAGRAKISARPLQEVLNYSRVRRMVREWSLKGKPFSEEWVLVHHAELLRGIVKGRLRGRYREAQCVIKDSGTQQIVYMAPEWRDVAALMKGLLSWLRQQKASGASALLMAAQFHLEFVTIHPFMDGNGRMARLLANGILMAGGYDVERLAALEKQHELDRPAYYRSIRHLQAGNYYDIPQAQEIGSWVSYWLKCLLATYDEALGRIEAGGRDSVLPVTTSDDDRLRRAESLFRRHQRLRASQYADLVGLGRTQAVADLNALVETGLLERVGGGRSTIYQIRDKSGDASQKN